MSIEKRYLWGGIPALGLIGASMLIFPDMGGDLISQAFGKSPEAVQEKQAKRQGGDAAHTIKAVPGTPDGVLLMQAQALFGKLPATMPGSEHDTPAMIALGNKLFFEKAVSINQTKSCSSCHFIENKGAGADHRKTGLGALGKFGDRNDPSVLNAGFQIAQFWDGRAPTLEEQAKGPPLNPIELAMPDGAAVAARLKAIDHYPAEFQAAFPGENDPVTFDNFAKAVAAFERTLISRSRFDRYLDGDKQALTGKELSGMRTFIAVGCVECHSGPNLGGMSYRKTGIFHNYSNRKDLGRFKVTKLEIDKYVFKVPMLRNVTLTGPYFHDGEVGTLAEAVDQMAYLQLNRKLKDEEIRNILSFLTTLAGEDKTTAPLIKVAQNTTTPIIKTDATTDSWVPPQMQDIPQGAQGDRIRYGALLLSDTYAQLGPDVKNSKMRYTGSTLNCTSCHLDGGTKQFGLPWMGVSKAYPKYSAREGEVRTLEARINSCFERSVNGRALPVDSKEMKAIVAYMDWLSTDVPKDVFGRGTPKFEGPNRKADVKRGELVYDEFCLSCHGKNGDGYQSKSAGSTGNHVVPALWGSHSYNNGAGTNRLLTTAAFIHSNMPLGARWDHPVITIDDAYDVAGYLSSKPRPQMRGLAKDYPKRAEKPADTSYPPYADNFPQEQHQYGPFQPIKALQKK